MFIFKTPQRGYDEVIKYSFNGDVITATHKGITDVFDFTNMPEGSLPRSIDSPSPIETTLSINPIIDARRTNGVMYVTLVNFLEENASEEDQFPTWMEV